MCDPVTLSIAAAAVTAGTQVMGGIAANQTAKQAARYSEAEGRSAMDAANYEAEKIRNQAAEYGGAVRARQAANNVDLASGSAVDVGAEIANNFEKDAQMALYGGRLRLWSKKAEAVNMRYQGKQALIGGILSAGGTLLGGAANLGGGGTAPKGANNAGSLPKLSDGMPTGYYVVQ